MPANGELPAFAAARRLSASSTASADESTCVEAAHVDDARVGQRERARRLEHRRCVVERQRAREPPAPRRIGERPGGGAASRRDHRARPAMPFTSARAPRSSSASVLIRPSMPPLLICVVEFVAVVGDQRHAADDDVVGLPARPASSPGRSRSAPAACPERTTIGAHRDVGRARIGAQRLVFDRLVAILVERAGIGADQQRLELVGQPLLLLRASRCASCVPSRARSSARSRNAAGAWSRSPRGCAPGRRPAPWDRDLIVCEHVLRHALDQRVRRFLRQRGQRGDGEQRAHSGECAAAADLRFACIIVRPRFRAAACRRTAGTAGAAGRRCG